jgi:hypothetical protein
MVHNLADFFRVGFGQRTAEYRKVLAVNEHNTAVDGSVTGHDAIPGDPVFGHAEIGAPVFDEHVPFFETACIKQQLDALAGRKLALLVLGIDAIPAAAESRGGPHGFKLAKNFLHG